MSAVPLIGPWNLRALPLLEMMRSEPSKVAGPVKERLFEPANWKSPLTTTGLATVRWIRVVWPP